MDRNKAIGYLRRRGKISEPLREIKERKTVTIPKKKVVTKVTKEFTKSDEAEIQKVMKEGKIYGDPMAEIRG